MKKIIKKLLLSLIPIVIDAILEITEELLTSKIDENGTIQKTQI